MTLSNNCMERLLKSIYLLSLMVEQRYNKKFLTAIPKTCTAYR
jgi:hypothetical protein